MKTKFLKKTVFRKTSLLSKVKQEEKYQTVAFYEGLGKPVVLVCHILDLNRSSYYKWKKRVKPAKEVQDETVCKLISEYDVTFKHTLGYRRMTLFINRLNQTKYSNQYIHRLMKHLNIKSLIRRKKYNYIKSKPEQTAENILNRDFTTNKPNEKWLSDVTEFKVMGHNTKLYLSAILDLYDNSIVSYKISYHNNNQLVFETFDEVIKRYPHAKPIFHSGRGYQYTSRTFKFKLDEQGMIQSMSRVGKCIDNGPMEAFLEIIKSEMYYLNKFYSIESLLQSIEEYIEYYNNYRFQAKLKSLTPIEYRSQANLLKFLFLLSVYFTSPSSIMS